MSVITDLYRILNTASGVRAYVGINSSPLQSRIYPGHAEEDAAYPNITLSTVTRTPLDSLSGVGNLHQHTIQISIHSLTFDQAQAIADAVHAALEGNGYQDGRFDFYDETTKTHSVNLEWLFTD